MSESLPNPQPDDLDSLFASAKANRPDTSRAEYGFETRLMARLRERRQPDTMSLWSVVTWRMVPFFATCIVALALWQAEVSSDSDEVDTVADLNNPVAAELGTN